MLIKPYKFGSKSAKALAVALRCLRTRRNINRRDVLNWGCSDLSLVHTINSGQAVRLASSKKSSLSALRAHDVPSVEWSTRVDVAEGWGDDGHVVYCRKIDNGHGGAGIVIATRAGQLVPAHIYTKYAKNKHEYRIHVFDGVVIHVQKKRRKNGTPVENKYIRNHDNGWVFCTENVQAPDCVLDAAKKAVQALGLVFGAVDIGYREKDNAPFVFEVNTAPGIEGTTVTKYAEAIRRYLNV